MDFRFGNIAALYYEIIDQKMPRQLDLLDTWFPGLILVTDPSDGETKRDAQYADQELLIHAVKYHGRYYSGDSARISQISGRLVGTAAGNKEKERKSAELIQKHVAECFVRDMTLTPRLKDNTARLLDRLTQDQKIRMRDSMQDLILELSEKENQRIRMRRNQKPFPWKTRPLTGQFIMRNIS